MLLVHADTIAAFETVGGSDNDRDSSDGSFIPVTLLMTSDSGSDSSRSCSEPIRFSNHSWTKYASCHGRLLVFQDWVVVLAEEGWLQGRIRPNSMLF